MPENLNQIAYEKLSKQFGEHVRHFELLDQELKNFAHEHGFALEINQWHRPCRVLRKKGEAEYVIEITQEGDWKKVSYREDLPHTVCVAGYFVDKTEECVYQSNEEVAYFLHFSVIRANIHEYLGKALAWVDKWPAATIRREGARSKHPMAYYRERGGIKIETVE